MKYTALEDFRTLEEVVAHQREDITKLEVLLAKHDVKLNLIAAGVGATLTLLISFVPLLIYHVI